MTTPSTFDQMIDAVNETEKEIGAARQGGGALFAAVNSAHGYLVFASGDVPFEAKFFEVTYFPPDKSDAQKANWAEALAKAKKYQAERQVAASPALTHCFTISKDGCYGKTPEWRVAIQHKSTPRFSRKGPDGKQHKTLDELIWPALESLNMMKPGRYFVRMVYVKPEWDPGTDTQPNLVLIPQEVYATEDMCRAAAQAYFAEADAAAATGTGLALPAGWDEKTFLEFKSLIDGKLAANVPPPAVAAEFGLPVDWMMEYAKKLKG